MRLSKHIFILFIILFFAFFIRFLALGKIPDGSTPDESTYIYEAYSIFKTQKDFAGNFLPLSFNNFNSFSPVPVYIIVPFLAIFHLSLFAARIPFALAGGFSVLLLYLIAIRIFKNQFIALASAFALSVSPWDIQFSKIAYDCSMALFFYLLGTFLFLKFQESKKIYLSLPAFLLGFYSYHATKLFLLLYIPLLLLFLLKNKSRRKKEISIFIGGIILIFVSFWIVSLTQNVTRQEVFIWNNQNIVGNQVDSERYFNKAPTIIKEIFTNKLTISFRVILNNYLYSFSPNYLFVMGEQGYNEYIYNVGERGMMYIIELPILLFGIFFLFKFSNNIRAFLITSLLVAGLPTALTIDQTYGARSIMMIPFLSMLVGLGIYAVYEYAKKRKKIIFYFICTSLIIIYSLNISDYLYQFYFRYSVYGSKYWNSDQIDVAKYIGKQVKKYKHILVAGDSGGLILYYGLVNKIDPKIIQKAYVSKFPKQVGNITFIKNCISDSIIPFNPKTFVPKNTLYVVPGGCYQDSKIIPTHIITWRDIMAHVGYKSYAN